MKRLLLLALTAAVILALDWAALHDLLKRNEPDYTAEGATLAASVGFFGYLVWRVRSTSSGQSTPPLNL